MIHSYKYNGHRKANETFEIEFEFNSSKITEMHEEEINVKIDRCLDFIYSFMDYIKKSHGNNFDDVLNTKETTIDEALKKTHL